MNKKKAAMALTTVPDNGSEDHDEQDKSNHEA